MYPLILLIIASGYLLSTSEGQGIDVGGWFELPVLVAGGHGQAELAAELHEWSATLLAVLVGLHVAGALKHAWWDRDGSLLRIFKPGSTGRPT